LRELVATYIPFEGVDAMKNKIRESFWFEDPCEEMIRMLAWGLGAINAGIYAAMPWGWLWGGVSAILAFLVIATTIECLQR